MKKKLRIGVLDFEDIGKIHYKPQKYRSKSVITHSIKALGYTPVVYKVPRCQFFFGNRSAEILYDNKKIKGCDVLIPRVDLSINVDLEVSIIKQFQLMGIPVINKYLPVSRAKNKLRTLQFLTRHKIPVPRTVVVRKIEYMDEAIKLVGGYPVILKTPFGSFGKGVAILESRRSLFSALDILWKSSDTSLILIQEFIGEANYSDYRAFVVGDRVVAAMQRTAKAGDFRSNLHLGGEAKPVSLTEQEERIAVKATKALGLEICGVDILRSKNGPVIIELNANPGIMGIMQSTGIDVASEMIKHAAEVAVRNLSKIQIKS